MKIRLLQIAEAILAGIIPVLEGWRERVAVCPCCGRNRYTGESCIKVGPANEPMGHVERRVTRFEYLRRVLEGQ